MTLLSRFFRERTLYTVRRQRTASERHRVRPALETLEDRLQPSVGNIPLLAPPEPPHPPAPHVHPKPPAPPHPPAHPGSPTGSSSDSSGYPFTSSNPLTSVSFNESDVLVASKLDATNGTFEVWYSDEHALALGVRQVVVKTNSGTTVTNYNVAALTTDPGAAVNPALGTTATSGDQAGTDTSGRLLAPSLYITDITNNPSSRSGDWQYGGAAYAPSAVFGAWKSFVRTVDYTHSATTPTVTLTADADPAKNGWNLGSGSDTPPSGLSSEGYTAEVRWNLNALYQQGVLLPGHNYRFYVIVHDGDQNRSGGDAGQAVYDESYPGPSSNCGTPTASLSGSVFNVSNGGQSGISGVILTLTGTTDTGQAVAMTATTAADGSYQFTGLQAGTYTITQTVPQSMTDTTTSPGTVDGTIDGFTPAQGTIAQINLLPGKTGLNYNFGDLNATIGWIMA